MKIGINASIVEPLELVDLDYGEVFSIDNTGELYMKVHAADPEKPTWFNSINLSTGIADRIDPHRSVIQHKAVAITASIYEYFGSLGFNGAPTN